MNIQAYIPVPDTDEVSDGLRMLTKTIHERGLADGEQCGFFGGEWGYGADFENDVFAMHRDYMDLECTCGHDERADAVEYRLKDHTEDCYQTELHRRIEEYERRVGWDEIEAAAFGPDVKENPGAILTSGMEFKEEEFMGLKMMVGMTRQNDRQRPEFVRWQKAHTARQKFQDRLYRELCKKYKQSRYGYAIHCTCGFSQERQDWYKANPHHFRCSLEMPHFWHKRTDSRIEWYKYIGRDMEIQLKAAWPEILHECLRSLEK